MVTNKDSRATLVNKYFIKTPEKPNYLINQILMIVGGFLLLSGLINGKASGIFSDILGLILLVKGFMDFSKKRSTYNTAYAAAEPKATDQQMDEWLKEYKNNIVKEAFTRLDIEHDDPSAAPLMVDGPAEYANWVAGADRVVRFRRHNVLLLFLTQHHVATFQCILDLATGLTLQDQTKEFPYKDITNLEVETSNSQVTHINGKKVEVDGVQRFSLFTSGTNRISVDYFFKKSTDKSNDYILPPSDAENTIKAIRKRLKEYKDRFGGN